MIDDEFEAAAVSWLTLRGYTVSRETPETLVSAFEEFWALYPRKAGKVHAEKAFNAANSAEVIQGLNIWLYKNGFSSDVKYIPHAATWINQRRYLDAPEARSFAKPQIGNRTRSTLDEWLEDNS